MPTVDYRDGATAQSAGAALTQARARKPALFAAPWWNRITRYQPDAHIWPTGVDAFVVHRSPAYRDEAVATLNSITLVLDAAGTLIDLRPDVRGGTTSNAAPALMDPATCDAQLAEVLAALDRSAERWAKDARGALTDPFMGVQLMRQPDGALTVWASSRSDEVNFTLRNGVAQDYVQGRIELDQ